MRYLFASSPLSVCSISVSDTERYPIVLFVQYYVDSDPVRAQEIQYCLHKNVHLFDKIVMLNEREYSPEEMGFNHYPSNIVQYIIGRRLRYEDVFRYCHTQTEQIRGGAYVVIANSDIFFDETLYNIRKSDLHEHKKCMAQLRYEYSAENSTCRIFGPRYDSQDAWIFHTNHLPTFPINVGLGIPGCDNKLAYLLYCSGFDVINHPDAVRTYHYHTSQIRRYSQADSLPEPYACILPYGVKTETDKLGILMAYKDEMGFNDNSVLYNYLLQKIGSGENYVIPRISTVETNEACCYSRLYIDKSLLEQLSKEESNQMTAYIHYKQHLQVLKTNAGIWFKKDKSRTAYAKQYMAAFEHCDLFGGWERWGNMYAHCGSSQEYIARRYGKRVISSSVFDIFHYVHHANPWTHALRGKRVLIISAFAETMKSQIDIRESIYGRDLFPDCTFLFLVPPQTQADEPAQDFKTISTAFYGEIDKLSGKYDVALVSCGGYGAPTVEHIYKTGGSAIYVGGVLQMYFGILGGRWLKERPDMVRAYLNTHWKRPAITEKPKGYEAVEGGCYW